MSKNTLDLTNKEDLQKFKDAVTELRKNTFFNTMLNLLDSNNTLLDSLEKYADNIYDEAHKNDDSYLPSKKLSNEQGLQIHKLVQEYVDTVIKPHNDISTEDVNDIYANLYEFAAWIINKE